MDGAATYWGNERFDIPVGESLSLKAVPFDKEHGYVLAVAGSAVGLGNIWRFPYEAGEHGGGAFLALYIGFIMLIGIPVICAEFIMGRSTKRNIFGAFRMLSTNTNGMDWL